MGGEGEEFGELNSMRILQTGLCAVVVMLLKLSVCLEVEGKVG